MKKYFILALALVLVLGIFTSCNNDSDGENTTLTGGGETTAVGKEETTGTENGGTTYPDTSDDTTEHSQTEKEETTENASTADSSTGDVTTGDVTTGDVTTGGETTDDGIILYTVEFFVDGVSYGTAQFEEGYLLKKEDFPTVPKTPGTRVSWPGNVVIGTDDIQVFAIVEDDNTTPMQTF